MMRVRLIDSNGDWVYGQGLSNYARDVEAVKYDIRMRLKSWQGDCFFSLEDGIPWNVYLSSKGNLQIVIETEIRSILLQTQDVVGVLDLSTTFSTDSRKLQIQAVIDTIYGSIQVQEII